MVDINAVDTSAFEVFIGKRLKLRRVMLRMSQDELASLVGVSFQQIQKYESGANKISATRLLIFSKLLGVDISYFFDGLENEFPELANLNSDSVAEEHKVFDPMVNNETLELVNAYWKLSDPVKRKRILDFVVSMV